jgi:hypothetical protein
MKATWPVILITVVVKGTLGQVDLQFLWDTMNFFGVFRPTFITKTDDLSHFPWVKVLTSSFIHCPDPVDMTDVSQHIQQLEQSQQVDVIIFLDVFHPSVLWQLSALLSKGVTFLVPKNQNFNLTLRLDTNLFLYEEVNKSINLFESYSIKAGPVITQEIGTWNQTDRLNIPIPGLWVRRYDLRGLLIRSTAVPYPAMCKFFFGKDNKIIGSSGYLQEILNQLQVLKIEEERHN